MSDDVLIQFLLLLLYLALLDVFTLVGYSLLPPKFLSCVVCLVDIFAFAVMNLIQILCISIIHALHMAHDDNGFKNRQISELIVAAHPY